MSPFPISDDPTSIGSPESIPSRAKASSSCSACWSAWDKAFQVGFDAEPLRLRADTDFPFEHRTDGNTRGVSKFYTNTILRLAVISVRARLLKLLKFASSV